jgi:hypothetical protein
MERPKLTQAQITKRLYLSRHFFIGAGISLCGCFLWISPATGQALPGPGSIQSNIELRVNDGVEKPQCPETQKLVVTVVNEKKVPLDRQATVKLHDIKRDTQTWDTTAKDSEMLFCNIDFGDYEIDASAVGYLSEHKDFASHRHCGRA